MLWRVTCARDVSYTDKFGEWHSANHLPMFWVTAMDEEGAKTAARAIVGPKIIEGSIAAGREDDMPG